MGADLINSHGGYYIWRFNFYSRIVKMEYAKDIFVILMAVSVAMLAHIKHFLTLEPQETRDHDCE